jgi:hypothetical protein
MISSVVPGGFGDQIGLEPGCRLVIVCGQTIDSVASARRALGSANDALDVVYQERDGQFTQSRGSLVPDDSDDGDGTLSQPGLRLVDVQRRRVAPPVRYGG